MSRREEEEQVYYPSEGFTISLPQTFLESVVSPNLPDKIPPEDLAFIERTYFGFISSWATTTNFSDANVEGVIWGLLAIRSQVIRHIKINSATRIIIDNLEMMALQAAKKSRNGWLLSKIVPAAKGEEGRRKWMGLF